MSDELEKYGIDDYANKLRISILQFSLMMEDNVSKYLSLLLGIKDYKNTKSFGNKSTSFSFQQKIQLLFDLSYLDKIEKEKLTSYMTIRNQFMHNIEVVSLETCFNNIDVGFKKRLYKFYELDKKEFINEESKLIRCFNCLVEEVYMIINSLLSSLLNKTVGYEISNKGDTIDDMLNRLKEFQKNKELI